MLTSTRPLSLRKMKERKKKKSAKDELGDAHQSIRYEIGSRPCIDELFIPTSRHFTMGRAVEEHHHL